MDIDLAELASLVTLLKEADFAEFRYDKGDTHIIVRRGPLDATATPATHNVTPPASAVSTPASASPASASPASTPPVSRPGKTAVSREPVPGAHVVTAPMLGTFYAAPKPGEPAFVAVGDDVGPDAVVCIVEVMKLMNSVHAGISGTILAVHAENGELVEYGQPLFSIKTSSAS